MGKHSGRDAFRDKLNALGYELGDNELNDAFRRFKDLADRKKVVFDEDLVALVDDEVMRDHERINFVSLDVHRRIEGAAARGAGAGGRRRAQARHSRPATARWTPPSTRSRRIFPHTATLVLFSVGAVTEGTDAQAKSTVRLEENGKMVDGQGADTDTIVASARAYCSRLNKLMIKRGEDGAGGDAGGLKWQRPRAQAGARGRFIFAWAEVLKFVCARIRRGAVKL